MKYKSILPILFLTLFISGCNSDCNPNPNPNNKPKNNLDKVIGDSLIIASQAGFQYGRAYELHNISGNESLTNYTEENLTNLIIKSYPDFFKTN